MENYNEKQIKYLEAKKKVERRAKFYKHAFVYFIINAAIFIIAYILENYNIENVPDYLAKVFWQIGIVDSILWGIGLLVHGFFVFSPNLIFGKNWEERKIKEIMEKPSFSQREKVGEK